MAEYIIKGHTIQCREEDWNNLQATGKVDVLFRDGKYRVVVRPFRRNTTVAAVSVILGRKPRELMGRVVFRDSNPLNLMRDNILAGE